MDLLLCVLLYVIVLTFDSIFDYAGVMDRGLQLGSILPRQEEPADGRSAGASDDAAAW